MRFTGFHFIFAPEPFSFTNWVFGISNGLKNKKLIYLYGMGFVLLGTYVALFNYIGFILSKPPFGLSESMIGFLFICQLAGSWSSYLFGKLTERYSRTRLMSWVILMLLTGSLMTLSSNIFILIIGLILFASGFLAGHSIASGWIGIISHPSSKAYSSSLYLFFYYIGSSVIGWSGGVFLSIFGWSGVIFMICVLVVTTGLLLMALNRSLRSLQIENYEREREFK
ncbi:MFS transporter [Bacillus wiedmannii]|uniref:MFS transporter n=1 Tax=Bacillus wiedmannii TaxID=1890302 RepID=UPI003D987D9B